MKENVLVKSEQYDIAAFAKKSMIVIAILAVVAYLLFLATGFFWDFALLISVVPGIGLVLILWLVYAWLHSYEIVITDKRVYGSVAFGRRVDLPLDSVSAIAISSFLDGVTVSTSSGRISFLLVKNADEIYSAINQLLLDRQKGKDVVAAAPSAPAAQSNADELKKYKELLDMEVITKEEFEAKKKQLLGL